jgi:hypothetical protein
MLIKILEDDNETRRSSRVSENVRDASFDRYRYRDKSETRNLDDIKDKIKEFKKRDKREICLDELNFEVTRDALSKYRKSIDSPKEAFSLQNTPMNQSKPNILESRINKSESKTFLLNTKVADKAVPTKYIGYSPMRLKNEYR